MATSTSTLEPPTSSRPSPHPLRPYYQPPPTDLHGPSNWLDRPPASSSSSSPQYTRPSLIDELQFSFSPQSSSSSSNSPTSFIFKGQPSTSSFLSDLDMDFQSNPYAADLPHLIRSYFNAGFMGFTSTAMVMPFEVGKTLMQVQWIPKDDELEDSLIQSFDQVEDSLDILTQEVDEDEDDAAYFTETRSGPRVSLATSTRRSVSGTASHQRSNLPETSSKIRRPISKEREFSRPEYILPLTVQGGVTDMIKQIFRWRGEGFIALWKGQLTTFITDTLSSTLQPFLLSTLSLLFSSASLSSISLPLEHHAYPALPLTFSVASYMITGIILSPLDLIRTRLIVQSSQLRYRKYSGPMDALRQILRDEGGWTGIYLHPSLFLPALLDNILRPALHLATPLVIDRFLQIDRLDRPVLHGLASLSFASLGLLLILPVETIRKRLQLQSRATDPNVTPFLPCVPLRPRAYAGIVEAFYRILTEETSQSQPRRRRSGPTPEVDHLTQPNQTSPTTSISSGLRQLYRGFNVGLTANVVAFVLGLLGNPLESSSNWAEV